MTEFINNAVFFKLNFQVEWESSNCVCFIFLFSAGAVQSWTSYLGMELSLQLIFLLLLVHSLIDGRGSIPVSLHGHGLLVKNNLGLLLARFV